MFVTQNKRRRKEAEKERRKDEREQAGLGGDALA